MQPQSMRAHGPALVASTAVVEGEVLLEARVSVWWNAVLRGDDAALLVGEGTNLQDLVMVHPDPGLPMTIGRDVTVGHHAVIHCVRIADRCLIGIGSILLRGVVVGEEAIVAAGAVVPEGMEVPPRVVVAGVPARILREARPAEIAAAVPRARKYWETARERARIA